MDAVEHWLVLRLKLVYRYVQLVQASLIVILSSFHLVLLGLKLPVLDADVRVFLLPLGGSAEGLAQQLRVL